MKKIKINIKNYTDHNEVLLSSNQIRLLINNSDWLYYTVRLNNHESSRHTQKNYLNEILDKKEYFKINTYFIFHTFGTFKVLELIEEWKI